MSFHEREQLEVSCHQPRVATLGPGAGRGTQGKLGPPWHYQQAMHWEALPCSLSPWGRNHQLRHGRNQMGAVTFQISATTGTRAHLSTLLPCHLFLTDCWCALISNHLCLPWCVCHGLNPTSSLFFPCWNLIRQEETAQGDLQILHGCCRGSLHTVTFLRQLSPINSLGSTWEKCFMKCLGSLNWKSYK